MEKKVFMTIKEVAKKGILPEHAIRVLIKDNKIPHIMCGNRYLINYPKFLEEYGIKEYI